MSEKPVRDRPRRLADWLNPTGDKKVHRPEDQIAKQRRAQVTPLRMAFLNGVTCARLCLAIWSSGRWTFLSPVGLSQSASLLGRSRTGFSLMELILTIVLTHLVSCLAPTTFAGRLPQPTRLPIARSRGFHPASGTIR